MEEKGLSNEKYKEVSSTSLGQHVEFEAGRESWIPSVLTNSCVTEPHPQVFPGASENFGPYPRIPAIFRLDKDRSVLTSEQHKE